MFGKINRDRIRIKKETKKFFNFQNDSDLIEFLRKQGDKNE
jgi:hypothetical protein